jgi:hypothetical protein
VGPVIWRSRKVAHLAYDMLPAQVDRDQMRALQPRAFPFFDPFANSRRKTSVYWALLRSFLASWTAQFFIVMVSVCPFTSRLGAILTVTRPYRLWVRLSAPTGFCGESHGRLCS